MSTRAPLLRVSLAAVVLAIAACGGGGYSGSGGNGGGMVSYGPPTVTMSGLPSSGTVNRTVPLTATVSAAAGVTRVEFLVDGTAIANVTMAPFTANWDTSAVANGPHTVAARVTDMTNSMATTPAVSVTVDNNPTIRVVLSADEVVPRPVSTASGAGDLRFNLIDGAVSGGVTVSGIAATLAHIHDGFAGANGPVIVPFVQAGTDPNRWDAQGGAVLTPDQIDGLLAGRLYVNVHSAAFPNGEIRGQIKPGNITVAFTAMTGAQVVPPVTTAASAVAATTIDSQAGTATIHILATGVDDATEAHVHRAAMGANNAAALLTLSRDSVTPGHWLSEQQAVTANDRADFTNSAWYADIHTPANPGGELRGQIVPPTP